ncbi:unnamed protein product [Cylicostephanus goldi]|uniref:Uncharacterized protein n=1 Tax=Cylicostephanus goldi TaxID=71465 RepID=A0A3P7MNN8_CYLGO|nr:unnamed protein product [Cylicostephanus goldi]
MHHRRLCPRRTMARIKKKKKKLLLSCMLLTFAHAAIMLTETWAATSCQRILDHERHARSVGVLWQKMQRLRNLFCHFSGKFVMLINARLVMTVRSKMNVFVNTIPITH